MHTIGKYIGYEDNENGEITIWLSADKDNDTINALESMKDIECSIDVEKYDYDHTPNQRKYFHKLNALLARKRKISFEHCKNDLIISYGEMKRLPDGNPIYLKINVPPHIAIESSTNHMEFLKFENDGWFYRIMKGTSELTVSEYNNLIDGTIYECRTEGIQTDTPYEVMRLKQIWERKTK